MDLYEAIKNRKSIRAYKPDPVPRHLIESILDIAIRSPSSLNSQPWEFWVIAGDVVNAISEDNIANLHQGVPLARDMGRDQFSGEYRDRQVALGKQIFKLMDITREDKVKRLAWTERGFRFFDAPAVIIICMDKILSPASMYDIGAIAQTITLAALPHGLGTCIQGQGIMYPDVVRKHAGIPDSKLVITCLTIGYPDEEAIVNQVVSEREPVEKLTVFRGF